MPPDLFLVLGSLLVLPACSGADDSGGGTTAPTGSLSSSSATTSGVASSSGGASSGGTLASVSSVSSSDASHSASTSGTVSTSGGGSSSTSTEGTESTSVGGTTSTASTGSGTGGGDTAPEYPPLLSEAGLYEADMVTLAEGVRPFTPRFALWSDGADKRRWIWLPEGEQIDTSDMDYWELPVGTRVYKEFSRDGKRVETRLLHKQPNRAWWRIAYQWREDQTEADAVPEGVADASGTEHDIPSTEDCGTCHLRMPDKVLGFSAIQLAHDAEDETEWTLARLAEEGRLTDAPPASLELPGGEVARAALGYMHANCGHCHNPRSSVSSRIAVALWLQAGALGSVEETPTFLSTVGVNIDGEDGPPLSLIIDPGSPDTSALFQRMNTREETWAMPPLASELVDETGRDAVEAWIESLE